MLVNARCACTRGVITVVILSVCLSVCLFPIYWLFKRFTQWSGHTSKFFDKRWRFSTKEFLRNAFFQELQSLSLILQFQVGHFVRILTNTMRVLGCTLGAKYSLLDLAKNRFQYNPFSFFNILQQALCNSVCVLNFIWICAQISV